MKDIQNIYQNRSAWKHVSENEWNDWKWQLKHSFSGNESLLKLLRENNVKDFTDKDLKNLVDRYRFSATPYYLSLIDWNDPNDPIRLQCIPDLRELDDAQKFSVDPFSEMQTAPDSSFVHRYPDRVLIIATNNCAMYCRHCTRKNTLDQMPQSNHKQFEQALEHIADKPEVREVLISGGDPLILDAKRLDHLLTAILAIDHIEVVRIGTRIPVVLPMRIDDKLVEMLRNHKPLWVNTQFNHPSELTEEAITACRRLVDAGIPVSNQSVLLKGINDSYEVMHELCAKLQRNLIRPYYVFQCDPIDGISHFRTEVSKGIELEEALQENLGGLSLPRFVADIPGHKSKTPLSKCI